MLHFGVGWGCKHFLNMLKDIFITNLTIYKPPIFFGEHFQQQQNCTLGADVHFDGGWRGLTKM